MDTAPSPRHSVTNGPAHSTTSNGLIPGTVPNRHPPPQPLAAA